MKQNNVLNQMPTSLSEAKEYINEFVDFLGMAFHPDTRFENYTGKHSGEFTYTPKAAVANNAIMNRCFVLFSKTDEDIYEYSMDRIQPILDKIQTQ